MSDTKSGLTTPFLVGDKLEGRGTLRNLIFPEGRKEYRTKKDAIAYYITVITALNGKNVIQSLRIFTYIYLTSGKFLNFCNVIQGFRMITDICLRINLYGMYIAQQGCSSIIAVEQTVAEILSDFCYRQETS